MHSFIIALMFSMTSSLAIARSFDRLVFSKDAESIHLVKELYFFDNRSNHYNLQQIRQGLADKDFIQNDKWTLLLATGGSRAPIDYWLRFEVDNQRRDDIVLTTENSTSPSLSTLYIFRQDSDNETITIPIDKQLLRTKRYFHVPPGISQILVAVQLDSISLPTMNFDLKTLESATRKSPQIHILSLSYGICLALLAYNIVLSLTLRNRAHFIYVAYSIGVLLYYEGRYQFLAEQFDFAELPKWILFPINASGPFLFLIFLKEMLDIPKNLAAWNKPIWALFTVWPLLIAFSFFDRWAANGTLLWLLILSAPLTICIGIHAIVKQIPGAKLLFVSAVLPGVGSFIHFQPGFFSAWLPISLIRSAQMIGLDIEMILLSMTIGFKINREQKWLREKIDHAYSELKSMVYPHQLDLIWQGQALNRTMPIGVHNAIVLVFDVIASSKMQIEDPRAFLSNVFRECSTLMMEQYRVQDLVANAYRIKELGDGFICSVGFPFACPTQNAADHSVQLAQSFIDIFTRLVQSSSLTQALNCSVGVAYGPVEAFYPEAGAQIYDMFGRAIILAHRYESMRDRLFQAIKKSDSIIILQQIVFDQLSSSIQSDFVEFDLAAAGLKVRDDDGARHLFYQLNSDRKLPSENIRRAQ